MKIPSDKHKEKKWQIRWKFNYFDLYDKNRVVFIQMNPTWQIILRKCLNQ